MCTPPSCVPPGPDVGSGHVGVRDSARSLLRLCLLAAVFVAGLLFAVMGGLGILFNQAGSASAKLERVPPPAVTTVTDATGAPIARLYEQYRMPLSPRQISPTMKAATVAVEDRQFYSEGALNPTSMARAVVNNATGGSTQGGSTITQQYVKNYLVNVLHRNDRAAQAQDKAADVGRKLKEARLAVTVDHQQSKERILTGYLNVVSYGSRIYGVGAAAQHYFHTTADRLTIAQSALLAGMVNNPTLYDPYEFPGHALSRRNDVIDAMRANHAITPAQAAAAGRQPLGVAPPQPLPSGSCYGAAPEAGFFCDYALSYLQRAGFDKQRILSGGYTIHTTMDPRASRIAKRAADDRVPSTQPGVANPFVVIKPGARSHDVQAMVSNRNFGTDANDGQTSTNQPANVSVPFGAGSIFKIFTTAAAMEQGTAGLNTELPNPDEQCFFPPNRNRFSDCATVHNDGPYPDPIPLREALSSSPNVAFTGLELRTGIPRVLSMASRLGLRQTMRTNMEGQPPQPAPPGTGDPSLYSEPQSSYNRNNISFTLGFSPFSPLELSNVDATLLDHGRWCPPNPIRGVTDRHGNRVPVTGVPCEQVVPPRLADSLVAGLGGDTKPGGTSQVAAEQAGWSRPTAAKTGTTQDNESVPFLGMVDGYAATSVVYADGSEPDTICASDPPALGNGCSGAFGGTIAAPTFFDAFNQILAGRQDRPLPAPDPSYLHER